MVGSEPTSPVEHLVDEYGRAMALVMPLVEDPDSSEALKQAWNSVLHDLAREVLVRHFKRLGDDGKG